MIIVNQFQGKDITEMDVKAIFRLVDVDKSGNISRTVIFVMIQQFRIVYLQESRMAAKLLMKRFGIKDVGIYKYLVDIYCVYIVQVPAWMKETDGDKDGRVTYKEFKQAVLPSKEDEQVKD